MPAGGPAVTLADLAHHLDRIARIATTTARYLTEIEKEIER